MGRPKKYHTKQQRINARKNAMLKFKQSVKNSIRVTGKYWRLVIPNLAQYGTDWTYTNAAICELRAKIVDQLTFKQLKRGLANWLVAVERHPGSRLAHLDILLVYKKSVKNSLKRYDYLIKHGNLTRYRTVNAAILDYGRKQDPRPSGDLDTASVIMQSRVKTQLYQMMQAAMLRDPFKFDPIAWLADNGILAYAAKTNMYKTIRVIKDRQNLECNRMLKCRPGIALVTPELIESVLDNAELELFRSWLGYQVIVDHINQIPRYGCCRPHKTSNLFLTGPPNTGKSSLIIELQKHCPVYPLGTKHGWFPSFTSGVYTLLSWDEFDLRCYPYTDLLKLLEGRPMKLPVKGGHVERADNQLIICTSNLTLSEHIRMRFKSDENRAHSRANLGVRFTEVHVPANKPLFILCKLIMPNH